MQHNNEFLKCDRLPNIVIGKAHGRASPISQQSISLAKSEIDVTAPNLAMSCWWRNFCVDGRVLWFCGYGMRLAIWRLWVRILALYTEWTFLHIFVVKMVKFVYWKVENKTKRGRGLPIKRNFCAVENSWMRNFTTKCNLSRSRLRHDPIRD